MKPLDECLLRLITKGELDDEGFELLHQNILDDPFSEEIFSISPDRAVQALEERLDFFHVTGHLLPECTLEICRRDVQAKILLRELWRFYAPLCLLFVRFMNNNRQRRSLFGLVGSPGSGKSVMAALLVELINHYVDPDEQAAAVCSLDGFHLPNAELERIMVDAPGNAKRPLRWEKGSQRTFDVDRFVDALVRIKDGETVKLPVYDRNIHDPVPDAQVIEPRHRMVFVEGNYLLLDKGPWYAIAPLLDLKCFLTVPLRVLRGAIIVRHVRGGRTKEDARRHFAEVDMPNYHTVMETVKAADLILKRDALQRFVGLQWNDQGLRDGDGVLVEPEETELIDQGDSL